MAKQSREDVLAWAAEQNWLLLHEASTPNGKQDSFLTPSGIHVSIIYDLQNCAEKIAYPPRPVIPLTMNNRPGLDLRGGSQLPPPMR